MARSHLNKRKIFLFFIGFILFIILAEIWISYHWLKVNNYELASPEIQSPVRLVVVSDLHGHEFGKKNQRLVSKIADQNPDLIILDGDILNEDSEDSHVPVELVQELVKIAPVYYALGNHEIAYMKNQSDTLAEELGEAGAVVLDGADSSLQDGEFPPYVDVDVQDTKLRIGGLYNYAFALDGNNTVESLKGSVREYLEEFQDTDRYKVMLSHRPDSFIFGNAADYWKIDLVLSGHDHGGQVVVPFRGGLYGGDQGWFPKYIHGMYEKGNMHIFVTSGLSSEWQKLPRWNNPPEIAVVDLTAE